MSPSTTSVESEPVQPQEDDQATRPRLFPIHDNDLTWIFGSGRSGSSWLGELLAYLPKTKIWMEPFFGSFFQYEQEFPQNILGDSVLGSGNHDILLPALRQVFVRAVNHKLGGVELGGRVVVKDVNSTGTCAHFTALFPRSRFILLVRDPYDILDSKIDMHRAGSWGAGSAPECDTEYAYRFLCKYTLLSFRDATRGYDQVRPEFRLRVRYEDLLGDPEGELARIARFMDLEVSEARVQEAVQACAFGTHGQTGKTSFRRFGQAGVWQTSGNFTPLVCSVAEETMGELRRSLGYGEAEGGSEA